MSVVRLIDPSLPAVEDFDPIGNALAAELAQDLPGTGDDDPCGELERLADRHRDQITRSRRRMAETRAAERNRVTAIEAEIARLKGEIARAKEDAARKIAADKRLIATAKAALNIAEGGLE